MFFDSRKLAESWNIRNYTTFRIENSCFIANMAIFEIVAPFENQFKWQIIDKKEGCPVWTALFAGKNFSLIF